jgi:hypothetical protein
MAATTSYAAGAKLTAFRVVGVLLGAFAVLPSVAFALLALVSDDRIELSHRFHYVAILAGLSLIGVFSVLFAFRPDSRAYFHAVVLQALVWLIAGLMGGDLIGGLWFTGPLGLLLLIVLHPDPGSLRRLPGRTSVALLTYAMLTAVPAWIYAVTMAQPQSGPASDPHVAAHHWSGVAGASLAIVAAAIAASLRGEGWRTTAAIAAAAGALFGLTGLVFPDLPGAPDTGWSWIAIAAGVGLWILAQIEASREPTAR